MVRGFFIIFLVSFIMTVGYGFFTMIKSDDKTYPVFKRILKVFAICLTIVSGIVGLLIFFS